jgi:hypothetical protein
MGFIGMPFHTCIVSPRLQAFESGWSSQFLGAFDLGEFFNGVRIRPFTSLSLHEDEHAVFSKQLFDAMGGVKKSCPSLTVTLSAAAVEPTRQ